MDDVSNISAEAIIDDIKAELSMLPYLGRFQKIAVISSKEWPLAIVQWINPLISTIPMKVFTPDQKDAALERASDLPESPSAKAPGIHFIKTTKEDVVAFEINGMITAEEMPAVMEQFDNHLASHKKVRLLNRIVHFGGFDPAVFMQGGLFSMKFAALAKVERYAIVGAPSWMSRVVDTMNPAFKDMEIKTL